MSKDPGQAVAVISPCPGCGYDLGGLPGGLCPECGRAYELAEIRRWARRSEGDWRGVRRCILVATGLWVAMAGAVPVLWVFEGQSASTLLVGGVFALGCVAAGSAHAWRIRWVMSDQDRRSQGPSGPLRWSAYLHEAAALLIALPIVVVALLLLLGAIAGVIW